VKEVMGSIASVRLDAVIGLAFSQSRSKLTGYISEEKVQVNGKVITSNAYNLKENDLISVRGLGKFRYKGTSAVTKKGRLMASVEVFV
jgi:RNA-binding protein YlmH